jgi:hypothetical protein
MSETELTIRMAEAETRITKAIIAAANCILDAIPNTPTHPGDLTAIRAAIRDELAEPPPIRPGPRAKGQASQTRRRHRDGAGRYKNRAK